MKQRRFCAKEIELPTRFTGVSSICLHDIYDIFFFSVHPFSINANSRNIYAFEKKKLLRLFDKTCLK